MEPYIKKIVNFFLFALAVPLAILAIVLFNAQQGLRVPAIFFDIGGIATLILGAGAAIIAMILRIKEEEAAPKD